MADPGVVAVASVGVALTKVLLRACDHSSGADLVGDCQEFVGILSRVLRRTDDSKGQIERHVSQALATSTEAMRERCIDQGVDPDLLSGACTEAEIILEEIAADGEFLLSAVRSPEAFPEMLRERAARRRMNVESAAEPYFDELLQAVATEYSALAPYSPRFQIEAFKSILSGIDEIQECSRRSLDAHAVTHDKLDTISSKFDMMTCPANTANRILFGSRPDVVAGDRFIERREQEQLNSLIADPTRHRTVLWGMRGCGKTQLAASLAKQCEDADWNLVAWINAVSPESIQSNLVELAKQLQIDTSDQPAQDVIIRRCLVHLKSADPADRLIVFDNVEDINHLRGLMPSGNGLRVVATTTNDTGWEHQDWNRIKVGEFDRRESIDYLLTVTNSDDREAADALADRLGDLPLGLAQAAASARNGNLSLVRYLDRLDSYGSERVIRPVPGGYHTDDVATALWMAAEDAVDGLKDDTKEMARRQLGVLALLAESGVPTRWLDPTIEQLEDDESPNTRRDTDEDAHDALTELIRRSIVQQSTDGSATMLHRLQAQVLRECWSESEYHEACAAASDLLGHVDLHRYPSNDTKRRRQETLDLVDQLRLIGTQEHSRVLFESPQITRSLSRAFSHASDLGLPYEALTLDVAVEALEGLLGPDHPYTLASHNNLAGAYEGAGRLTEAIALFEQVLADRIRVLGEDHLQTLTSRNNLAGAYEGAGRLTEAIALYEQVLADRIRVLGKAHPHTLTSGNNLACAYDSAGRLTEAIALFEQVLADRIRVLGKAHPHTLTSGNNLACAYRSAGRLTEAIALYEEVLADSIRVLGEEHPDTLMLRNNLAGAYESVGRADKATVLYEQVITISSLVLGEDHPHTLASRNNLAGTYMSAGRLTEAIALYEQVLADSIRVLGEDHPHTLASSNNLVYACMSAGRLTEAITLCQQVISNQIRVLGEDHPHTLTSRHNLAAAYASDGNLPEAIMRWHAVCADCLRILGPDHPLTEIVRENLEAARRELAQQEDGSHTEERGTQD